MQKDCGSGGEQGKTSVGSVRWIVVLVLQISDGKVQKKKKKNLVSVMEKAVERNGGDGTNKDLLMDR